MKLLSRTQNTKKPIIISMLSVALVLALSTTAFAGYATSTWGYYTVYNRNYSNYCGITTGTSNGTPFANTSTRAQSNPTTTKVPVGYLGSKARLYDGSNRLIAETSYVYNSTETATLNSDFASKNPAVSGTAYYGYGITAAYNGNGYTTYYTFKSPSQST